MSLWPSKPPTCHVCGARLIYVHPEWHMERRWAAWLPLIP